ncbi:MAG: PIN domain-containing protein [Acidimicrobiia bacterium]|jgi:predicted nucleic acid-binding protein|nr:PIN domain-containing protein [Acidimicrobiia bacterium]
MRCYVDSSAIAKLAMTERESPALRNFLKTSTLRLTSLVSEVEVRRATIRRGPAFEIAARRVLSTFSAVDVSRLIVSQAATVSPPHLRSLDALHLATALTLMTELDWFVTYDVRLGKAAEAAGLVVAHPGVRVLRDRP